MKAGLGLGSNLGDRLENLRAARKALARLSSTSSPVLASPIYETKPIDCEPGAPMFWNAVIELDFAGNAADLLAQAKAIEVALGRDADHPRNVSRSIDIDLLYFGESMIEQSDLQLPHPRMFSRRFVLQPLSDIRPELVLPGQDRTVAQLLAQTGGSATLVASSEQWS